MEPEQPQSTDETQGTQQLTKKQRRALAKQQKRDERVQAERGRKAKSWLAWFAVVAVIALLIGWLMARSNSSGSATVPPSSEIIAGDWTKGGADAEVKIIEYSDFQCPACGAYYPIIKQLTEEFGDSVQFAYRHFPLASIHQNAEPAARAAEAAGVQNAFWDMHDMLFERQNEWSNSRDAGDLFAGYAEALGLDTTQFEADYNSDSAKNTVKAHEQAGRRIGVAGTPTFVLNGEKITNPTSYEAFRSLVVSIAGEPEARTNPDEDEAATTTQKQAL